MNEGYIFADYIIVRKTAFVLGVHSEIGSWFVVGLFQNFENFFLVRA